MNSPKSVPDANFTAIDNRFDSRSSQSASKTRDLRDDERKASKVAGDALADQNQPNWVQRTFNAVKSFVSPLPPERTDLSETSSDASSTGLNHRSPSIQPASQAKSTSSQTDSASSQTESASSQLEETDSQHSAVATSQEFDKAQTRDQFTQTETQDSKVETGALCYSMMVERNRSFDRQIEAKSKDLQNALLSQQRLQRSLNKLSNLPASPNSSQKKEIEAEIERAKADGVEWTGNSWTNEQGKTHLLEEIRIRVGELQAGHSKEHTKLTRLSDTQHQFVQMFISIMKALHESKVRMAQAIR